jgi:hypothetical protein
VESADFRDDFPPGEEAENLRTQRVRKFLADDQRREISRKDVDSIY